jgi:hypothetical protein
MMRGRGRIFLLVLLVGTAHMAVAQRPVQMFDPFYRGESAGRTFFDTYALTAELTYRPPGFLQADEAVGGSGPGIGAEPIGLNLLFEYRLSSAVDAGAYIDASGNAGGRSLDLSWLMLKYHRHRDGVDYAIRLAVDPSSDARGGFPQMDLGFLYAAPLAPTVSTDFGIGVRRVQVGFQELVPVSPVPVDENAFEPIPPGPVTELLRGRAVGWELHMTTSYRVVFDPGGSNLFLLALAQTGSYDVVEWTVADGNRTTTGYRGGVVLLRSGLEIARPSYVFMPYLSLPLTQWAPESGEWPGKRARIGVRFMLR